MNYVVFDLEFNQGFNIKKSHEKCPFEIIQIGAVILDDKFEIKDTFNRFIKPQIYENVNPYITSLTGLTIENLKDKYTFEIVYYEFLKCINKNLNITFCTWGNSDMKELFRNVEYYKLSIVKLPKVNINLQPHVSKYLNFPKNITISLRDAIDFLSIKQEGNFHDAYYDALHTAKILKKIYNPNVIPAVYDPYHKRKFPRVKKQQVNIPQLIHQFEKMYQREMTEEERSIIKTAYLMGKSHQFLNK